MFNIGGGELLVILLIALIVLGPSRLPDAARQVGKVMGDLRRMSTGFQNEMKSALDTGDDPKRVASRRNVLAKETPDPAATSDAQPDEATTPTRKTPLTAQPVDRPAAKERPAKATSTTKAARTTKATKSAKAPAAKATKAAKSTKAVKAPTAKTAKTAKTASQNGAAANGKAPPARTPPSKKVASSSVSKAPPRRNKA